MASEELGPLLSEAYAIFGMVHREMVRAVELHGPQLDTPLFDLDTDTLIADGNWAKASCQRRSSEGRVAWSDILLEEIAEAMDERDDPEALRTELIQSAAMCVAMVRALNHQQKKGSL